MPKLNWLSDEDLYRIVEKLSLIAKGAKEKAVKEFGSNVVDPFSAVFEMSGFNMTYAEWTKSEEARQAQKTVQNFIGGFHQDILGSCKGWENLGTGKIVDIISKDKKIIAEIKNKFNTISGTNLPNLYRTFEAAIMHKTSVYKGYKAYHVAIIPKKNKRFDLPFTPSDKETGEKCPENELIRQIDGASFYKLVTGDDNALEQMFDALPLVINDLTGYNVAEKTQLKELFNLAIG
jgi:hypothetical protein